MYKKINIYGYLFLFLSILLPVCHAQEDGVGQTIQIYTHLDSFAGRPSWLLVIRDIDHNQNIPYVYDFTDANNFWVAITYGRNYLIEASTLQFAPYRYSQYKNSYSTRTIHNFCGLESRGRIIRGDSLYITISGDLTPDTNTFNCNVLRYANANFTVVNQ